MVTTPGPLARARSNRLAPLPARPNRPARRQPAQPLAPSSATSLRSCVRPPPPTVRRRWPLALRLLLWSGVIGLIGLAAFGGLILAGQTELVAWIIVGAALTVVFGTPLLCVAGLFVFYVWAMTRMGRSRQRPPSKKLGGAQQAPQTIIVGDVVLDEWERDQTPSP